MKKLTALFNLPSLPQDIEINELVLDSRKVKTGDLFVAIKGHQVDATCFIEQAILAGASAIVAETGSVDMHLSVVYQQQKPVIYYYNLSSNLSEIADKFYDSPSKKLTLVGVTGTNGKTTVSQLLAQWVRHLGHKSAVMGTIGNGLLGQVVEAKNTTGSPIEIQSSLASFINASADFVAIEVSSHGLVQHRVEALDFNVAIFTNLSRDHLDYHGTMEDYTQAKKRFFFDLSPDLQILNADDPVGAEWLKSLPNGIAVSCEANFQPNSKQWLKAVSARFTHEGTIIDFTSSWGNGTLNSPLIGAFNVSNLLLAMATLLALGYSLESLINSVSTLQGVRGRMEMIKVEEKSAVIVDYAHTPDALEKALVAAREHCNGKLWCIFGCGGDRDRGKRPLMAKVAEQFADMVIVTTDNPRTEEPDQIEADIVSGFSNMDNVGLISDRAQAIEFAIQGAQKNDLILIAGKGHEDYQIVGNEILHFSDQETAEFYLTQ
ncbi:UDP-N-acetylmuramoyl-L-alanyl-D-glutamate--2,6-diaminopimelate ligase [Rodentibacter caecimuris]|uniref:UDP-N-acetylmuramoyl-L-alanyl-D-glutamate--2,6-diaminopimelate ligase n=1 Tax=Rodentibacter caecimuris TaxID=1796644 RepID=A0AAJ3K4I6_9PAST|nr:UDP-N-acetylmuramoyl-L-alanyl-D-glutamate--2,6-diaminopimelate ligase [Rodentibacter heylii]AOF53948.1 UDP-N-acetylmuramoylalanyl-D-glutamate--2,6- diaminopimelate ligase [Pasteurellaceae bacterium NI1060]MCQ9124574.1 UDP-N-acetylmuramoyl-L-alanyl-D-glutamate--2,6-diaminopimelate ligase [Rodentibacter heylii]OOF71241.1 UDP-N-acetylmuramoyl-L-alanyl-D-glutamate--2,6-diaminopimelate ligase [Rodentibacter heylii]OOF72662.1 UDP-N-acetylmuramoyl-L-alanyl-D-glutamate--2,6-diaminopimelate ligase [R